MSNTGIKVREPIATDVACSQLTQAGLLTVEAAAQFLSISRTSLYAAMARGELPWCQLGRSRRIPRRALVEYAAANLTGGWARQSHT